MWSPSFHKLLNLEDNKILTRSDEIAESMNQYFCTIGQKLSEKIPHAENPLLRGDVSLNKNSNRFQFRAITPADFMKAMQKFKVSKSFGQMASPVIFSK